MGMAMPMAKMTMMMTMEMMAIDDNGEAGCLTLRSQCKAGEPKEPPSAS